MALSEEGKLLPILTAPEYWANERQIYAKNNKVFTFQDPYNELKEYNGRS